jgi:hypothetical protein
LTARRDTIDALNRYTDLGSSDEKAFYDILLDNGVNEVQALSIINHVNNFKTVSINYTNLLGTYSNDSYFIMVRNNDGNFERIKPVNGSNSRFEFCDFDDSDAVTFDNQVGFRIDLLDQTESKISVDGLYADIEIALCDSNADVLEFANVLAPQLREMFNKTVTETKASFDELKAIMDPETGSAKAQLAENTAKKFNADFGAILPWLMAITITTQLAESCLDAIYDSLNYK